ncbi:hypothetical protein PRK78_001797 [Emydomyces testavorans]|uniref:Uncharacterized protein n=1 Tax=Emydomyces testavorans TaxID=2070801 RepID=A0AAF0IJ10_9EURO|nr:hypothetical protein PRK78_001797 [Emydomyces testavorans]
MSLVLLGSVLFLLDLQNFHGATIPQSNAATFWGDVTNLALSHDHLGINVNLAVGKLLTPDHPEFYQGLVFDGPLICFSRAGGANCNIATSPDNTSSVFVVGCGASLVSLTNNRAQWDLKTIGNFSSPIRAVDWLSRDVIIAGLISSKVWLHDIRSRGSAARFQHGHGVQSLKTIDEWKVVVAGSNRTLSMYDLRFTSNRTDRRPQPNNPRHKATTPYLNFSDVQCNIFHNIDICHELGLLACASELHRAQLFSLTTGKRFAPSLASKPPHVNGSRSYSLLGDDKLQKLTSHRYSGPISSVKFENLPNRLNLLKDYDDEERDFSTRGGAGVPSLLISSGSLVDEWRL